jgi:hypothetical protein
MQKIKNPYESAMEVFEAHAADDADGYESAVKAAVRVAMISERARCIDICKGNMSEYEAESNTPGVLPDVYIRGYKDGSEDCIERMKGIDAVELAEHDAAVARLSFEKEKKPSPYLIDILAKDEAERVEQEAEEGVVWVE